MMKRVMLVAAMVASSFALARDTPIYNGRLTSALNAGGFAITNAPEPVADGDVATKKYVDESGGGGGVSSNKVHNIADNLIREYDATNLVEKFLAQVSPLTNEYSIVWTNDGGTARIESSADIHCPRIFASELVNPENYDYLLTWQYDEGYEFPYLYCLSDFTLGGSHALTVTEDSTAFMRGDVYIGSGSASFESAFSVDGETGITFGANATFNGEADFNAASFSGSTAFYGGEEVTFSCEAPANFTGTLSLNGMNITEVISSTAATAANTAITNSIAAGTIATCELVNDATNLVWQAIGNVNALLEVALGGDND